MTNRADECRKLAEKCMALARTAGDPAARATLLTMALTLALLSAFSLMDPDGRFRVPAEVLLLPLAPAGWIQGLTKFRSSFSL